MTDKPISELTVPADAAAQTYQLALSAFREWRSSFADHKAEETRFAEALARHKENPEITMPEEYEGIENLGVLAQMNANKRGYLEGRFEGVVQALSKVAGGDPMDWNIRIQNETSGG
jgi:hypothetical protein